MGFPINGFVEYGELKQMAVIGYIPSIFGGG
jgi:hypothetical protein